MSLLNHKDKCRLCFQSIRSKRDSLAITRNVQEKFFRITNVELTHSDKFSKSMCKTCKKSLEESSQFQLKMIDNQRRLYAFVEYKEKLTVKEEPLESTSIQLQEISIEDCLPKAEVWAEDQASQEFEEISNPASPDNDSTSMPQNEPTDCTDDSSDNIFELNSNTPAKRTRNKSSSDRISKTVALRELSIRATSKKSVVTRGAVTKGSRENPRSLIDREELRVRKRADEGIPSNDNIENFVSYDVSSLPLTGCYVRIKRLSGSWDTAFRQRNSGTVVLETKLDVELSCDICGYSVVCKDMLRIHVESHARKVESSSKKIEATKGEDFHKDSFSLTDLEELQVKLFVNKRTEDGIPSSDADIEKFIWSKLLSKRHSGMERPSSTWFSAFRERHSDMNVLEKSVDVELNCDICGFSIKDKKKMRFHIRFHAKKLEPRRPPIKPQRYSSDLLQKTMQSVADGLSVRKAAKLHGVSIHVLYTLRKKMLIADQEEPEIFKCSFCEKFYYDKATRHNHEKLKHLTPVGEFRCEVCRKICSTRSNLVRHVYAIHKERKYRCTECSIVFDDLNKLRRHQYTHKKEVACHICGKLVNSHPRKMFSHMASHKPREPFQCTFEGCKQTYRTKTGLYLHLENVHGPKQKLDCPKCSSTFSSATKLRKHDAQLHSDKKFSCVVETKGEDFHKDSFSLTDLEELQVKLFVNKRTEDGIPSSDADIEKFIWSKLLSKRHSGMERPSSTWISTFRERHSDMNVLEKSVDVELNCDICGFSIKDKKKMRFHIKFHAKKLEPRRPPIKPQRYSSDLLKKTMQSVADGLSVRKAAKLHGVSIHVLYTLRKKMLIADQEEPEIFKCSFCEKFYYDKATRHNHEKLKHLTPVGEFRCEVCRKICSTRSNLVRHVYAIHKEQKYRCTECSIVFDDLNKLRRHQYTHKKEVACHICGKLVNSHPRKMFAHMASHKPGKPFQCTFEGCKQTYRTKTGLNFHLENVHGPKQKVDCPKCSSTFSSANKLRKHDAQLHSDKKFACVVDGCSYKTPRREYLKLHLTRHKDISGKMKDDLLEKARTLKAEKDVPAASQDDSATPGDVPKRKRRQSRKSILRTVEGASSIEEM